MTQCSLLQKQLLTPEIWLLILDFAPVLISLDPGDDFFLSIGSLSHLVQSNFTRHVRVQSNPLGTA